MNEKIKLIALECYNPYGNFDLEKFAELIVRECSQMAHNSHPDDLPFVGGKMLVHFGVEE
jgi:hypothetical protein